MPVSAAPLPGVASTITVKTPDCGGNGLLKMLPGVETAQPGAGPGIDVGRGVGVEVGAAVGAGVAVGTGVDVGPAVGTTVGVAVGRAVGTTVGVAVGPTVGTAVGVGVGVGDVEPPGTTTLQSWIDPPSSAGPRRLLSIVAVV
jgi:hypothetical protein